MSLYNCKSTAVREVYRITKFTEDLEVESSYLTGSKTCECPAFAKRKACRHSQIRTMFMLSGHVDDEWMLDFDTRQWTRNPAAAALDLSVEKVVADNLSFGVKAENGCAGGPILPNERSEASRVTGPQTEPPGLGAGDSAIPAPPPAVERKVPGAPVGGFLRGRKL